MLAVAFGPPTMAAACAGLSRIREVADCVELRLDLFEAEFDLPTLLRERGSLPLVATVRPPEEGGRSPLAREERLKVLVQAAELGAEYVDLEWDAAVPAAMDAVHAAGAQVIVSRHDFARMPDGFADRWWSELADLGADVVKVVGTCREARDSLEVLRVFARASRPTIAIGMGEAGLPTRVLALLSNECLLTYAALGDDSGTAPGQVSVADMRDVYHAARLGSGTRVYGLLGPHVERDRLAEYNAWFADDGVDAVSVPFAAVAAAAQTISAFRELPVDGWHLHGSELQRDALSALDSLSPEAARQAKVNAVVRRRDASLEGHWVESPREQYELWRSAS